MILYSVSPDIKVKTPSELLTELPEVVLVNKFDEEAVEKFRVSFGKAVQSKQPIVPIIVDSYGGQVYALLAMIDVIRTSPKPIATIAQGKAMSCGSVLLSMGREGMRFMGPNATVMIHDVSNYTGGKVGELKADVNEAERLNKLIFKIMANNVGKPESYFLDIIHSKGHADWYLTSDECREHNLVNHVRIPSLKVNVNTTIEFA